jgi:hypothetical protein
MWRGVLTGEMRGKPVGVVPRAQARSLEGDGPQPEVRSKTMSHTWKLLPLAALFAIGVFLVATGSSVGRTNVAFADHDAALTVSVDTDPEGGTGYEFEIDILDKGTCDDDLDNEKVILDDNETSDQFNFECDDEISEVDVRVKVVTPNHSELKSITCSATEDGDEAGTQSTFSAQVASSRVDLTITDFEHVNCLFDFDFDSALVTPTVTVTTTPAAAATVTGSSNPTSVACGGTSIISFTVKNAAGNAVPTNTAITFTTTLGTLSPTTGTTASDGSVFVFFTAPSNQGGSATITATASNNAKGTATVQVNCGQAQATATSTTSPPPTVAATSTPAPIKPPSTGDAGLDQGRGWTSYAGIALIAVSIIGALALVRARA